MMRMKCCIGVDIWSVEYFKAVKQPTVWYKTPPIYRERDVEYAEWLSSSEYL